MTPWTAAHQLPCSSLTLRACSNYCPSNQWCHPTISSSLVPFSSSSCLQSFPASGPFPVSQFFTSGGQSIGSEVQGKTQTWMAIVCHPVLMVIKTCMSEKKKQSAGQFAMLSVLTCFSSYYSSQPSEDKGNQNSTNSQWGAGPLLSGERVHFEGVGHAFQGSSRKPLLGLCCDDHIFSVLFHFCTLRVHKFP